MLAPSLNSAVEQFYLAKDSFTQSNFLNVNTSVLNEMMDLYTFNQKTIKERSRIVSNHGQYLAVRVELTYSMLLFFVDKYFVEVWYDKQENEIFNVKAFKSPTRLDPYLDLIDLSNFSDIFKDGKIS